MSEIPAVFMLNKRNPNAESYGCVTVKTRAVLVGHGEEMIHEKIKIFATIDKDNGDTRCHVSIRVMYARRNIHPMR